MACMAIRSFSKLIDNHTPDNLVRKAVVLMPQNISDATYPPPFDLGANRQQLVRYSAACLGDDFDRAFDCKS